MAAYTREMVAEEAREVFRYMAKVNLQGGMFEADQSKYAEKLYRIRCWSIDQLQTERQMELMMEDLQKIREGIDLAVDYKQRVENQKRLNFESDARTHTDW